MEWILKKNNPLLLKKYIKELEIDKTLAKILINRDISIKNAKILLKDLYKAINSPFNITNAKEASFMIKKYLDKKNCAIVIFSDYDTDGITGGYVLKNPLKKLTKNKISVYYPERHEGYGLNMDFCKKLVKENKVKNKDVLLITVDNGITKVDEIAYLKKHNIEVIVTDHHKPKEIVPDCLIVNPHLYNDKETYLCGCGIAFKLAQLVLWQYNSGDTMMFYTPALAIATLADSVPLSMENLAIINYGIRIMNSKLCPEGLKYYKEYLNKNILTAKDLMWDIIPRINACGRMGDVNAASKIFFVDEFEEDENLEDIVNYIETLNDKRKEYTKDAQKQIEKMNFDDDYVCIIDDIKCPYGILGIIAGKAVEQFKKPALVIDSNNTLKGSGRSIDDINLFNILDEEQKKGTIKSFGGHEAAVGLQLKDDNLDELKNNLNKQLKPIIDKLPKEETLEEEIIYIDDIITLSDLNIEFLKNINQIPYNDKSLKSPIFMIKDLEVTETKLSKNNEKNICFSLKDKKKKINVWFWNGASIYDELENKDKINIIGTVEKNFMNPREVTLKILDMRS